MSNIKLFHTYITQKNLKKTYFEKIYYTTSMGVDNISPSTFNKKHLEEIEIINKKVKNNTYKFSKYRLKLINKGKNKPPRDLYIPTIRDRLLLKVINDFLLTIYNDDIIQKLPQIVVKEVKEQFLSNNYDTYVKVDIQSFYPSINKEILINIIKRKVRSNTFIRLIKQSLNPRNLHNINSIDGVPQGLSISNTLAYLYLIDIDKNFISKPNLSYFRFVDDILIFCNEKDIDTVKKDLHSLFQKKQLTIHPIQPEGSKSKIGKINHDHFEYLGYKFTDRKITIRESSANKIRNSLVEIFTAYKYDSNKNIDLLKWSLNLKISGCIHEKKSKGWVFFYSQVTDISLIYELDHFVKILANKFRIPEILKDIKKFSTTFFEINHNLNSTKYIPNFDKINLDKKINILEKYFDFSCKNLTEEEINDEFQKRIRKKISKLLTDPRDFS
ncbi:reverse transcriptase domain-containing protein [Acinetobacter venetianus]|uniref:reverse transcriptase domain-containing protein n=1 Tax=Acinetobacter venetianus TaxID=52133 RepID=UPI0009BDEEB4|nr:reverse transcriptase domain-containing protein [Acinetobacter venetianus]